MLNQVKHIFIYSIIGFKNLTRLFTSGNLNPAVEDVLQQRFFNNFIETERR